MFDTLQRYTKELFTHHASRHKQMHTCTFTSRVVSMRPIIYIYIYIYIYIIFVNAYMQTWIHANSRLAHRDAKDIRCDTYMSACEPIWVYTHTTKTSYIHTYIHTNIHMSSCKRCHGPGSGNPRDGTVYWIFGLNVLMCMYVYVLYVYVYVCMRDLHVCMYACMYVWCVCIWSLWAVCMICMLCMICMYACMHDAWCMYAYTCMYKCICVRM
jgi:hypothetical protein